MTRAALFAALLFCCFVFADGAFGAKYGFAASAGPSSTGQTRASVFLGGSPALSALKPDYTVHKSFASSLPLLVFETSGLDAAAAGERTIQILVYDSPSGRNALTDQPGTIVPVSVRPSGKLTENGKNSYALTLAAPKGEGFEPVSALLGLPESREWRLQGSSRDRGMLRNGLAYELGRLLLEATPQTRYCEVLSLHNGEYVYEGLYILGETTKNVFERIGGSKPGSLLLMYRPGADRRRNPVDGSWHKIANLPLAAKGFSLLYPDNADKNALAEAQTAIDKLEETLQSHASHIYLQYTSQLDQDSVIDTYILNAVMLTSFAGPVPFYLYKEKDGPFHMLPVWDFDAALDNMPERDQPLPFEEELAELTALPLLQRRIPVWRHFEAGGTFNELRIYPLYAGMNGQSHLWFNYLFLSRPFVFDLHVRYRSLRRDLFAHHNLHFMIDRLSRDLGPALERDWFRREKEYTRGPFALSPFIDKDGDAHIRQAYSFDQELNKMHYNLNAQSDVIVELASQLTWLRSDLFDQATSGNTRAGYGLLAMLAFLAFTHLVARKM